MMKLLKNSLLIRGDSVTCPLAFSLDTYSNCEADCVACHFRRLNYVWDKSLRPMDVEHFKRTLANGVKNNNPKSPLAWAMYHRKTLRFGNKADPFQEAELKFKVSKEALLTLKSYQWPVVIETKFTHILREYEYLLWDMKSHLHIMPIISPGFLDDWEILERKATTRPDIRLEHLSFWAKRGIRVGVNGEPFIPGYHTVEQFEDMLKLLKHYKIPSYNVYNLHLNEFVAKRLHQEGIDIEKIWEANKDENWKPVLQQLIDLAKKYGIILGCPDFVNSGNYVEASNTCCGVDVDNPCRWNVIMMKKLLLIKGVPFEEAAKMCWDGVGNYEEGMNAFLGKDSNKYNLRDCGIMIEEKGLGFN